MTSEEQLNRLIATIRLVLPELGGGPTLSQFGIAREDCALAHIDYFTGISTAAMHLREAVREATGEELPYPRHRPCDCRSCAGEEAHAEAVKRARASYTGVKEWK